MSQGKKGDHRVPAYVQSACAEMSLVRGSAGPALLLLRTVVMTSAALAGSQEGRSSDVSELIHKHEPYIKPTTASPTEVTFCEVENFELFVKKNKTKQETTGPQLTDTLNEAGRTTRASPTSFSFL